MQYKLRFPPVNGVVAEATNHTITVLLGRLATIFGVPMLAFLGSVVVSDIRDIERKQEVRAEVINEIRSANRITDWRVQQLEKEIESLHKRMNTVQDVIYELRSQLRTKTSL